MFMYLGNLRKQKFLFFFFYEFITPSRIAKTETLMKYYKFLKPWVSSFIWDIKPHFGEWADKEIQNWTLHFLAFGKKS